VSDPNATILGHRRIGGGPRRVVVMNDWLSDTTTWDACRPYLDEERFSWVFADLRGYGASRGRAGSFDAREAADDVLARASAIGWPTFSIVGHSMSTYVAMHLAQHAADRVERVVLITPAPRRGFGAGAAWIESAQADTRDDTRRAETIRARFAGRLCSRWAQHKTRRWIETSDANAAAEYIAMFARDGLPSPDAPITTPVLVITGEEDAEPMRSAAVRDDLSPICAALEMIGLAECGHYPMQEMPPRTVMLVERFIAAP
jgi:3-oxoadipate enol-lactonase